MMKVTQTKPVFLPLFRQGMSCFCAVTRKICVFVSDCVLVSLYQGASANSPCLLSPLIGPPIFAWVGKDSPSVMPERSVHTGYVTNKQHQNANLTDLNYNLNVNGSCFYSPH